MVFNIVQAKKEVTRWNILRILHIGRPDSVNEEVISRALAGANSHVPRLKLRQEIGYLADCGLVDKQESRGQWTIRILAAGVDVVEGNQPTPAGIHRPPLEA